MSQTDGAKVAVGTAYSTSSRVWYSLDAGCVTEIYYPTIDTPQIRDLQFLFTYEPAYNRYVMGAGERKPIEIWKSNRQVQTVPAGTLLRIQANSPFLLHWTSDDWQHSIDTGSQGTTVGIEFVDVPVPEQQQNHIRFTFLWLEENRWEGKDYRVNLQPKEGADNSRTNVRGRRERGNVATNVGKCVQNCDTAPPNCESR